MYVLYVNVKKCKNHLDLGSKLNFVDILRVASIFQPLFVHALNSEHVFNLSMAGGGGGGFQKETGLKLMACVRHKTTRTVQGEKKRAVVCGLKKELAADSERRNADRRWM